MRNEVDAVKDCWTELDPRIEFILILDHREMDRFNIRFTFRSIRLYFKFKRFLYG